MLLVGSAKSVSAGPYFSQGFVFTKSLNGFTIDRFTHSRPQSLHFKTSSTGEEDAVY